MRIACSARIRIAHLHLLACVCSCSTYIHAQHWRANKAARGCGGRAGVVMPSAAGRGHQRRGFGRKGGNLHGLGQSGSRGRQKMGEEGTTSGGAAVPPPAASVKYNLLLY